MRDGETLFNAAANSLATPRLMETGLNKSSESTPTVTLRIGTPSESLEFQQFLLQVILESEVNNELGFDGNHFVNLHIPHNLHINVGLIQSPKITIDTVTLSLNS